MPDAEQETKIVYPGHTWGALAADPWMEIGLTTEDHRAILRRYWVRNGGLVEDFERLVPPRGQANRHLRSAGDGKPR